MRRRVVGVCAVDVEGGGGGFEDEGGGRVELRGTPCVCRSETISAFGSVKPSARIETLNSWKSRCESLSRSNKEN